MAGKEMKPIESLDWLYHLHYIRGEYDVCEQQIDRFDFKSDYSHHLRGLIRLRKDGDAKAALQHLNQVQCSSDPTYVRATIRCLVLMGRHSQVVDMMRERALVACPNDWQVWHMIGMSMFHLGNLPLAKDAFQRSMQATSKAEPFLFLAKCHITENDVKSAIFVLRKACESCPDDVSLTIKLGVLLLSSGMIAKGNEKILQLQHVSANTPGNLQLALSVGSVLQESRQDVDGALYRYKLANTFECCSLWNNIALCFAARKKVVGAISCLKRAHYLNPFDWRITYNLGILHMQMRQFASAFNFLKSAAAMSEGAPHVVSFLAISLECLQDDVNASLAHIAAAKSALLVSFPTPILNYAVFLCKSGRDQHRDEIIDLMMEFEKCWVQRKQSEGDFDLETMRLATKIATVMDIVHHMAWIRVKTPDSRSEASLAQLPSSSGGLRDVATVASSLSEEKGKTNSVHSK